MSARIEFHPVLDFFLDRFNDRDYEPSGMKVGNMDRLTIGNLKMVGGYYVCAETVKFVSESVKCTGPDGGLVGGNRVRIEAPEIHLEGEPNDPIQIVAIQSLNISGTNLKMHHVALYLFDNADFSIQAANRLSIRDVQVIQINMREQAISTEKLTEWADNSAFDAFVRRFKADHHRKDAPSDIENLLERLELDREAASKIGLRSILV